MQAPALSWAMRFKLPERACARQACVPLPARYHDWFPGKLLGWLRMLEFLWLLRVWRWCARRGGRQRCRTSGGSSRGGGRPRTMAAMPRRPSATGERGNERFSHAPSLRMSLTVMLSITHWAGPSMQDAGFLMVARGERPFSRLSAAPRDGCAGGRPTMATGTTASPAGTRMGRAGGGPPTPSGCRACRPGRTPRSRAGTASGSTRPLPTYAGRRRSIPTSPLHSQLCHRSLHSCLDGHMTSNFLGTDD